MSGQAGQERAADFCGVFGTSCLGVFDKIKLQVCLIGTLVLPERTVYVPGLQHVRRLYRTVSPGTAQCRCARCGLGGRALVGIPPPCFLTCFIHLALTQHPIFPGNHVYLNKSSQCPVHRWVGGLGNLTRLVIEVLLELLPTKHYSMKLNQSRAKRGRQLPFS